MTRPNESPLGTGLQIILDGDGCWPDLKGRPYGEGVITSITALPNATSGGAPSVTFRVETNDGKTIILAETTMRLFLTAARAFRAKFVEQFPDLP
jgi:hypothetical protein